jgi:DNA-binding transcriptional LysR family regulator
MVLSAHMPDLDALEVFVAIAQTGSLGGAARELGLTQQAVSRRLAALEAKTGVTLAIRTTRGSQITPAGTSLAEWASHLLEVAHDIDTALGSLRIEGTQRLTVVASPTIVEYLMPVSRRKFRPCVSDNWWPGGHFASDARTHCRCCYNSLNILADKTFRFSSC